MNDYYDYYKSHGICVTCGQEKAKKGRVRCWRCLINQREHEVEYRERKGLDEREKLLAERREKSAVLRAERKEKGLCPNCGREKKNKNYSWCEKCRASGKKSAENKRRSDGILPNWLRGDGCFCAVCLKPVESEGSKLCNRCAENISISISKARAAQNNADHPWRQLSNGQYKLYMAKKNWKEEHGDREGV